MKASASLRLVSLLALSFAARAQAPAEPAGEALSGGSGFLLNLIPKAFVANPMLEMTVFTEFTEFGRTLTPATPYQPVYFEALDKGLQSRGYTMAGNKPPPREELIAILHRALAAAGYLPAGEGHRPGLALVYFWGTHNALDPDMRAQFPELAEQYLLERATLVGGRAYRHELETGLDFGFGLGDRMPKKIFLFNQASDDLYYAVVSAYAYDDLAHNERRLVWRTTMTVNARGVSMGECLPPLIVTAGNYFGHATDEPVAIRRQVRRGTVTLGPLVVIADDVPAPKPSGQPPK